MEIVRNTIDLVYGDFPTVKKLINLVYGELPVVRNSIELEYNLLEEIKKIVNLNYHIIQEELRSLIDLNYDIKDVDQIKNLINIIYSIVDGNIIQEITTLSVVNENGKALDPYHINIEKDELDPCIRIDLISNVENDYDLNPQLTKVLVTVNSDVYTVLVEERETSSSVSQDGESVIDNYTFRLSSPCILLGDPYAGLITEELSGMASDIVSYVVSKESSFDDYNVEWNIIDWYIPPGTYSVSDATPLGIIEELATVAGGIRQSKLNGDLEIRKEYPIDVSDYDTETPDVYLTDQENYYSVVSSSERNKDYNNFLVTDQEISENELSIVYEDISSFTKEVRVFQVPWENDTIRLNTSAEDGYTIREEGIKTLQIESEEVEIVDGSGSLSNPIYSLTSSKYLDANLGAISFDEDGNVTTNTEGNSILYITYNTKFHKYIVTNNITENVQFWPEII